jgi:hypothetical protein
MYKSKEFYRAEEIEREIFNKYIEMMKQKIKEEKDEIVKEALTNLVITNINNKIENL